MQNQTHNFLLEVWEKYIICCHVFSKYRVSNTNSRVNEQECLYKKIYLLINEGFFRKQIIHLEAIPLKKFIHDIYRILEVSLQNGRFIFLCSTKFSHQIKPLQIQNLVSDVYKPLASCCKSHLHKVTSHMGSFSFVLRFIIERIWKKKTA